MERNFRAELTGVFGDPVDGNPTGYMEEAAYEAEGLNYRYLTVYVKREDLKAAVEGAKAMNMKGFNLTMPHKIDVIPMLDELTEAAGIIGAVNTVLNKDGYLIGDNTDGRGFVQALKNAGYVTEGKTITILGAGGAAKAIAVECALSGAKSIRVINRTVNKGQELASLINKKTSARAEFIPWTEKVKIPEDTQILIQATNVGLFPDVNDLPDIDYASVPEGIIVSDVVFNPAISAFLKKVQERGAITISGLGMLACQGALNYTIWTGKEAPLKLMEKALAEVM